MRLCLVIFYAELIMDNP